MNASRGQSDPFSGIDRTVQDPPWSKLAAEAPDLAALRRPEIGLPVTFELAGIPRTKKNSRRWFRQGKKRFLVPSAAYERWEERCIYQLNRVWHLNPISVPVKIKALVYRDRNVGDLDNFIVAVGDMLQKARVLASDRLVKAWDGSRLLVDRAAPRVELTIERMEDEPT